MALDFLKQFKSELPPGMADFFLKKIGSGEMNLEGDGGTPRRSSLPVDPAREARIDAAREFMTRGQDLAERENFTTAAFQFEKAIATLVGKDVRVPSRGGYISQKYLDLDEVERSMLMSSCAALGSAIFNASVLSGRNDDIRVRETPRVMMGR